MNWNIDPEMIAGLSGGERDMLAELLRIWESHRRKNAQKEKYYQGNISLRDVNLGIALPDGIRGLEIGCAWGAKTVDVLAARSMFDGFVDVNGRDAERANELCRDNQLIAEYMKATRDELKFGCTFATLSPDGKLGCRIRFHSPLSAAAKWDGYRGGISCGMAVIAAERRAAGPENEAYPTLVYLYTDTDILALRLQSSGLWRAERHPHALGRPLMEPLVWNATSLKPLGRSRIKEPVRRLIDGYVRTVANATIGLEFSTTPQKYLLGITDEQYDAVVNQKFRQYVGSILAATTHPDTGEVPKFGQLAQGSIAPHVEMIRMLATQFSAATGLSVTDTGVVNDANPSSSDAIEAQSRTLVGMAEQLNAGNGDSLRTIILMATAVADGVTLEDLSEEQKAIVAHFRNPAMPSVAATADAAIKIASARTDFAQTDTFLEMIGFSQADIRRIKAQESRTRGLRLLTELEAEG